EKRGSCVRDRRAPRPTQRGRQSPAFSMEQVADMYQLFVWEFLQPYAILFLVTGFALLRLWHRRQETRARLLWVSLPFAILFVISLPAVADLVLGSLEWKYPPLGERPADVQAIVVLASYVYPPAGEGGLPELDE